MKTKMMIGLWLFMLASVASASEYVLTEEFDTIGDWNPVTWGAGSTVGITKIGRSTYVLDGQAAPKDPVTGAVGKAYASHPLPVEAIEGDIVTVDARFRVLDTFPVETGSIYMLDLECQDCGIDTQPGLRVLVLPSGQIVVNLDKLQPGAGHLYTDAMIPGTSFVLTLQVTLGDWDTGHYLMWLDGNLILDEIALSMPLKSILGEAVAESLNLIQVGATANSRPDSTRVLVDFVTVWE